MASIPANNPPPKPWERAGGPSSSTPFRPPSAAGSTSDVVEASGTARPGEIVGNSDRNATINRNAMGRPVPVRPWEQNYGGMYGSYGGIGGMFGNSSYQGGGYGRFYGPGMYGGGGGMYNGSFGGPVGGYQIGMGGSYGPQDPNDPSPPPPGFWISVLRVMQRVVNCFGRISILIDQNAQAFHMFMTALLQLFDRSGRLYGELARFVLRLLGFRSKLRKVKPPGLDQHLIEGPKAAPASTGSWDNVWENDAKK